VGDPPHLKNFKGNPVMGLWQTNKTCNTEEVSHGKQKVKTKSMLVVRVSMWNNLRTFFLNYNTTFLIQCHLFMQLFLHLYQTFCRKLVSHYIMKRREITLDNFQYIFYIYWIYILKLERKMLKKQHCFYKCKN